MITNRTTAQYISADRYIPPYKTPLLPDFFLGGWGSVFQRASGLGVYEFQKIIGASKS